MTKEEADLIIAEQNKSKEEILKAVAKVKSDCHELCKLKDMRIAELEKQIIKMRNCQNCDNEGEDYYGNACCKINKSFWDCDKWEIRKC